MSKILFAWELGNNLGHLARDLPVAERLREMGHEVAFAVRDTTTAAQLLLPRGFGFVQAPYATVARPLREAPASYAEILLAEGYGQGDVLLGRVRAWWLLFDLCRPHLVIADHAPTALAAAAISGLPALPMGNGFDIPPQRTPMPSIRPWEIVPEERLIRAETLVCETLDVVAMTLGGKPLARLCDLFANPVLATFPELDHYGPREDAVYIGPMPPHAGAPAATWPTVPGPRTFAYLRPSMAGFSTMLSALSGLEGATISAVPGISRPDLDAHVSNRHCVVRHHVALDPLLAEADIAVSYGGAGLIDQSLAAGKPLLLLPQTVEQWLRARLAVKLGTARIIGHRLTADDVRTALIQLQRDERARSAARNFARRYADRGPKEAVSRACAAIEGVLRGERHSPAAARPRAVESAPSPPLAQASTVSSAGTTSNRSPTSP